MKADKVIPENLVAVRQFVIMNSKSFLEIRVFFVNFKKFTSISQKNDQSQPSNHQTMIGSSYGLCIKASFSKLTDSNQILKNYFVGIHHHRLCKISTRAPYELPITAISYSSMVIPDDLVTKQMCQKIKTTKALTLQIYLPMTNARAFKLIVSNLISNTYN